MGGEAPYQEAVDTYAAQPLFQEAARYAKVFGQDIESVLRKTTAEWARAVAAYVVISRDYDDAAKQ